MSAQSIVRRQESKKQVWHPLVTHEEKPPMLVGRIAGDTTKYIKDFLDSALAKENHDPSMYYFAIVATACYLESVLEDFAYSWCKTKSQAEEPFLSRLMEKIGDDVNRATGLDKWKQWTHVLFDVDFPDVVGEDWQTLTHLFTLRNQLAHGRTTKFTHFWNANNGRFLGISIEGSSYRQPFEYLIKSGVIQLKSGEVPSVGHFFTHKVALHFATSVRSAIKALSSAPLLSELCERTHSK